MNDKDFIALLKEFHVAMWKEVEEKDIFKTETEIFKYIEKVCLSNNRIISFNDIKYTLNDKQFYSLIRVKRTGCFICGFAKYKALEENSFDSICNYCNVFPDLSSERIELRCLVTTGAYSKWLSTEKLEEKLEYIKLIQDCFPES